MKRLFALLFSILFILSFSACGNSNSKQTVTDVTPAPTSVPTPEPTPVPTPEPAPEPTPVPTSEPIPDLAGDWEQTNINTQDLYQIATISGDVIEVYWKMPDRTLLYWSGTFAAPTAGGSYSWESIANKEKNDMSIMGATADTKKFTYSNGELSFDVQAMGSSTTVRMAKK